MTTKIRLQRDGRGGYAFYSIAIADSRTPRDSEFVEKIGTYNPNTNPAAVNLSFDRALCWLEIGTRPTDTACNIPKREGVYLMRHLRSNVEEGTFDKVTMQSKFSAWKQDKDKGLQTRAGTGTQIKKDAATKELEAKKKINAEITKKMAGKKAAAQAEEAKTTTEGEAEVTTAEVEATTEKAPAATE